MTKLQYININNEPIAITFPAEFFILNEPAKVKSGFINKNESSNIQSKNFSGTKSYKFSNDLYNQIHILKPNRDYGFISDNVVDIFEVWNAYYIESKTLNSINYDSLDNVVLTDQNNNNVSTPITLQHLTSIVLKLNIISQGNSNVDGNIVINTDGFYLNSNIKFLRSILFDFEVDFSDNINEIFSFNTDIIQSYDYSEQRIAKQTNARAVYTYNYILDKKQRRNVDKLLYSGFNSYIALPLANQIIYAKNISGLSINADITNTIIQPELNILIKENEDKKEIATVAYIIDKNNFVITSALKNTYKSPMIIPIVNCRIDINTNANRVTNDLSNYTIQFNKEIDNINPLITNNDIYFDTINNIPVLREENNRANDVVYSYYRNMNILDNGYSKKTFIVKSNVASVSFNYEYITEERNQISLLKNLFRKNKGQLGDLYSYSFNNSFEVIENISKNDIILIVENDNLTQYYKNNSIKYAVITSGNIKREFEIKDIYVLDDDKEVIVIDSAFGLDLKYSEIDSAQFIFRGRLADDTLSLRYYSDEVADTVLNFVKNNDRE